MVRYTPEPVDKLIDSFTHSKFYKMKTRPIYKKLKKTWVKLKKITVIYTVHLEKDSTDILVSL